MDQPVPVEQLAFQMPQTHLRIMSGFLASSYGPTPTRCTDTVGIISPAANVIPVCRVTSELSQRVAARSQATAGQWEDRGLTLLATVIAVMIAAIVFRKLLIISGLDMKALLMQ